jgi:hypothetical protein
MASVWGELKRRSVVKVAVAYAIVAWLLIQIIVSVEGPLNLPDWIDTFVIVLLAVGFVVLLIPAWAYELTPDGVKQAKSLPGSVTSMVGQLAEFDPDQPIQLRGTLTKIELINPHSWFHSDVVRENGAIETWAIEAGTPNTLFRKGINKNTLPLGIEIIVDGYRAKNGTTTASGRDITFSVGRQLYLEGSAPPAPE